MPEQQQQQRRVRGLSQSMRTPRTVRRHQDKTLATTDDSVVAPLYQAHHHHSDSHRHRSMQKTRIPIPTPVPVGQEVRDDEGTSNEPIGVQERTAVAAGGGVNTAHAIYSPSLRNNDIYVPPVLQDGWRGRDDDVADYHPYSPTANGHQSGQLRQWPAVAAAAAKASETTTYSPTYREINRPIATNHNRMTERAATATSTTQTTSATTTLLEQQQRGGPPVVRLENVMERIDRTAATLGRRSHASATTQRNAKSTNARSAQPSSRINPKSRGGGGGALLAKKYYQSSTSDDNDNERYHPAYRSMPNDDEEGQSSMDYTESRSMFSSDCTGDDYTDDATSANSPTATTFDEHEEQQQRSSSRTTTQLENSFTLQTSASHNKHRDRLPVLSKSESESTMGDTTSQYYQQAHTPKNAAALLALDDILPFNVRRQEVAYATILLTASQFLILALQLLLCGYAAPDVNPMLGPYPDQYSAWGGKNLYRTLHDQEWWRLVTPAFLHVGVLHFLANAFGQLYVVAVFEREWGWWCWCVLYVTSAVGGQVVSNYCDPDTIAVGSSGALMGLFGAKLAQVVTLSLYEVQGTVDVDDVIRFDQLTSVLFGLTLVSMLGALTYVDWSGNMGGLATGFMAGIVVFSGSIYRCCSRFVWCVLGLVCLLGPLGYISYLIVDTSTPDEQLADVCEYFRSFFAEGYECGCPWQ
jgi:membrane associated rhomboid family serine protease